MAITDALLEENGIDTSWEKAAQRPAESSSNRIFKQAGEKLGFALANAATWVQPKQIVLYLPEELATDDEGLASARYLTGARAALGKAFSSAANTELVLRPRTFDGLDYEGGKAAAATILDDFCRELEEGPDSSS